MRTWVAVFVTLVLGFVAQTALLGSAATTA
jgi:hypothetical protein